MENITIESQGGKKYKKANHMTFRVHILKIFLGIIQFNDVCDKHNY